MNENRKENQLSLLYVDLDDFKKVNDAHGHHIGDGRAQARCPADAGSVPRGFHRTARR